MAKLTPYRMAVKASMSTWPVKGYETSEKIEEAVSTLSQDELENMTWATGSLVDAVKGIAKEAGLTAEEAALLEEVVLGKGKVHMTEQDEKFMAVIAEKVKAVPDQGKMVVNILAAIHDGWVANPKNAAKFNQEGREGKKYQHLPLEMIGLPEAGFDHLFLNSVLESMGVEVPMPVVEKAYEESVTAFYTSEENKFYNEEGFDKEAMVKRVMEGSKFYPALSETNTAKTREEALMVVEQSMAKMAGVKIKA